MTPPNPSEAAREAAAEIVSGDSTEYRNQHGDEHTGESLEEEIAAVEAIIQSALDSALSASAARVKELEDKLGEAVKWIEHAPEDTWGYGSTEDARWPLRDELASKLRRALSIKVGETK